MGMGTGVGTEVGMGVRVPIRCHAPSVRPSRPYPKCIGDAIYTLHSWMAPTAPHPSMRLSAHP